MVIVILEGPLHVSVVLTISMQRFDHNYIYIHNHVTWTTPLLISYKSQTEKQPERNGA